MFGKGGIGNLMKQAQQMQEKMQQVQAEIAALECKLSPEITGRFLISSYTYIYFSVYAFLLNYRRGSGLDSVG